ncbi:MAG: N-acetyl-gamma-glutamyl-phosphate reductase [Burkholderiales bacterium]|nr:N-acetyl-gamma-glutamyl-phosphate reductase [Burkholderiales bacterium]
MIKVGLVGGTGYTGVELLRILASHPQARLHTITSRADAGTPVAAMFPSLRGKLDLVFADPEGAPLDQCDVVFFATPHGVAMSHAPALVSAGIKVIDLAADFRLQDLKQWDKWYQLEHTARDLLAEAVYGLPEMNRDPIRTARVIGNPGCYATAVQLGFLPLIEAGVVDTSRLVADAKSGVSGAGRKSELGIMFSEVSDNFRAYGVSGHRHHPEMVQGLSKAAGRPVSLVFVPHLTPAIRGIHATLYASLTRDVDVQSLFEERFRDEPFVDVMPGGSHPDTRSVRGANTCRIAVHRPENGEVVVVLAIIDNLVKGASGQAVQNMNLMFGIDETTALDHPALMP